MSLSRDEMHKKAASHRARAKSFKNKLDKMADHHPKDIKAMAELVAHHNGMADTYEKRAVAALKTESKASATALDLLEGKMGRGTAPDDDTAWRKKAAENDGEPPGGYDPTPKKKAMKTKGQILSRSFKRELRWHREHGTLRKKVNESRTPKPVKGFDPKTDGHIDRAHLRTATAHDNEMTIRRADPHNWGWGQDFGPHSSSIASKTSKGVLETRHDHKTGKITHEWED